MATIIENPPKSQDCQDNDFILDSNSTRESLLTKCLSELDHSIITRDFVSLKSANSELNSEDESPKLKFRILSWNILAQALAVEPGTFCGVPEGTFDWPSRRLRILYKILFYNPDVICLQEIDHFNFLKSTLNSVGYEGVFQAKPSSPCLKMANNNGPDGCAIFWRRQKFNLISSCPRILQNSLGQPTNQVALIVKLKMADTPAAQELFVVTTHLKSSKGFETLRNEQANDLSCHLNLNNNQSPLILCGDFNAVPTEPAILTVKNQLLALSSAYTKFYGMEPPYTRWKIRHDKEFKDTIDYIFYNKFCRVNALLPLPSEDKIGKRLPPNLNYPSDHLALVCDFEILGLEK